MRQVLVLGGPGAGKTTRLLSVMEEGLGAGLTPDQVAFVAFTNAAADEARDRAMQRFGVAAKELPYFRTIHSLAFREMGIRRDDVLGENHLAELSEITGELFAGDTSNEGPAAGRNADPLLTIDHYARTTQTSLRSAWFAHGGDIDWLRLKRFSEAYRLYKEDRGLLDFTDMLQEYVSSPIGATRVRLAIVDEAQDLTPLQWATIEKAFSGAEELYVAGDDDQCQPSGNRVLTLNRGYVDIGLLDPKRDRLASFARRGGAITGFVAGGFRFKKSSRRYSGRLYEVRAGGFASTCTADHKWLIKWTDEARASRKNVVYLMRKEKRWRVGWTQLFQRNGTLHLNCRANSERADGMWILKLTEDKREAYAYEQIVCSKYGIPMIPFVPHGGRAATQMTLDSIFEATDSETGALRALADHDLSPDHPLINRARPNYSRYGAAVNEVVARNLIPELMMIPVETKEGRPGIEWRKIQTSSSRVKNLTVHSISVKPHETYVSNGMVTHNSIHRWAGADEDRLLSLPYEKEILPLSHRLPRAVHALSLEVVHRVSRRYEKEMAPANRDGRVEWLADPEEIDLSSGTWLMLARTRAQLVEMERVARGQGVLFSIKGKSSIDRAHLRAIQAHEALRAGKRIESSDALLALSAAGARRIVPEGTVTANEIGYDASPIWHDALVRIPIDDREYYLSVLRSGGRLTEEPRVRIETVHGAKGKEAEHVVLSTDLTHRTHRGFELDPDSEHRVFYVGITRASQALWLVSPRGAYGYRM